VCLGVGLLCVAPAALRADPENASATDLILLDSPWLTGRASADEAPQEALGDSAPAKAEVLGSLAERPDATWHPSADLEENLLIAPQVSQVRLSPSECSGLLMCQGLLIVGLYRGRRRWAAALLALLALTRSGISAITEIIGLPKAPDARSTTPVHPSAPMETHRPVRSPSLQRTYAGLLRRLAAQPAAAAPEATVLVTDHRPATRSASVKRVAGSVVPTLSPCPEASVLPLPFIALYPSQGRDALPSQLIAFSLFARPPP